MSSEKKNLTFEYNSFGQRIAKHVYDNQTGMLEKSTYYILDAQGQQLSMYEHVADPSEVKYHLAERNIYGSSRLGTTKDTVNMYNPDLLPSYGVLGYRNYELSNHLGNVLAVITDVVVPLDEDTNDEVDGYQVALAMTADYSPFGVQLDGRTFESEQYRYTFQAQEKDDEVKGAGNSVNYTYRMHDPRIGRFFVRDPLAFEYPHNSPYAFSENSTIAFIELEGLEKVSYRAKKEGKYGGETWHDYTGKSDARITQALGWVEQYHQGHISTERVKRWKPSWYVTVVDQQDYWGRSYGTEISFYNNREDWVNDKPFKVVTQRDFSQWFFSNGDGSEQDGHEDPTGTAGIPFDQGIKIMGGTVAVILTGGAIVLVGEVTILNVLSIASGLDDMTTQADGSSVITKSTGINSKNLDNVKIFVGIASFTTGTRNLIKKFANDANAQTPWTKAQVMELINIINDELSIITNGADQIKKDK